MLDSLARNAQGCNCKGCIRAGLTNVGGCTAKKIVGPIPTGFMRKSKMNVLCSIFVED